MSDEKSKTEQALWGGRFSEPTDQFVQRFTASQAFDRQLASYDIAGSRAYASMLEAVGVLTAAENTAIQEGLARVLAEIEAGAFQWSVEREDVHMNIEARLTEKIGEVGKKLHTGRSRNDQVATDFKLWTRDQMDAAIQGLEALIKALLDQAEAGADWVMPGFTHLQTAQPVTWGHHMMAYVEMLGRDVSRFKDARARMNESPLGAAALAGPGGGRAPRHRRGRAAEAAEAHLAALAAHAGHAAGHGGFADDGQPPGLFRRAAGKSHHAGGDRIPVEAGGAR